MSKLFAHAKRMLTGVLVVATILTTAPTYAFATENTDVPGEPAITAEAEDTAAAKVTQPAVDESEVVEEVSSATPDDLAGAEETEEIEAQTGDALLSSPDDAEEASEESDDSLMRSNYAVTGLVDAFGEEGYTLKPASNGNIIKDGNDYYISDASKDIKVVLKLDSSKYYYRAPDFAVKANDTELVDVNSTFTVSAGEGFDGGVTFAVEGISNKYDATFTVDTDDDGALAGVTIDGAANPLDFNDGVAEVEDLTGASTVKFAVEPVAGYEVSAVKISNQGMTGQTTLAPDSEGKYSFKVDADMLIAIETKAVEYTVPVYLMDDAYTGGASVLYKAGEMDDYAPVSKSGSHYQFSSEYEAVDIKVTLPNGYENAQAYIGTKPEDPEEAEAANLLNDDGEGTVEADKLADAVKKGIYVYAEAKDPIEVSVTVDGHDASSLVKLTGVDKVTDKYGVTKYYATNRAVTVTFSATGAFEGSSATATINDEPAEAVINGTTYTWTVSADEVAALWGEGGNLVVSIAATPATETLTFKHAKGLGTANAYVPVDLDEDGVYEGGDEPGDPLDNPITVPYNSSAPEDVQVFTIVPADGLAIESVKQGSTVLKPVFAKYYREIGGTKKMYTSNVPQYTTVATKVDQDITITYKNAATEDVSAFVLDVDDDLEYDDLKYTVSGATKKHDKELDLDYYQIAKGATTVTITVTTAIGEPVSIEGFDNYARTAPDSTFKKRITTYAIPATLLEDAEAEITEGVAAGAAVTLSDVGHIDAEHSAITINGTAVDVEALAGVVEFDKVTITLPAEDHYSIKKIEVTPADAVTNKTVDLAKGTVSFVALRPATVTYTVEGIETLYADFSETEDPVEAGKSINLGSKDTGTLFIASGAADGEPLEITSCTLNNKKAADAMFAVVAADKKSIAIDASKASANNISSVSLTIKTANKTWTVTINVAQTITSVTLAGFKKDGTNFKIDQVAGTIASYKVTLNKGASLDDLALNDATSDGIGLDYDDKGNAFVVVELIDDNNTLITDTRTIKFETSDGTIIPATYTVNPVAAKIGTPTVTVANTSDYFATLNLGVSKADAALENLFYEITATAVPPVAEGYDDTVTAYVVAGTPVYRMVFAGEGAGKAQKYNIVARLVQTKDAVNDIGDDGSVDEGDIEGAGIFASGSEKKLSTATKAPYYETALGLNKKTTTFIAGTKNVTLATAKYSAKTTYLGLAKAVLVNDATGEESADLIDQLLDYDSTIFMADTSALAPGKYTLKAWAKAPDGVTYNKPATLAVTVQQPVTNIAVTASPSASVYKAENKALTIKLAAVLNNGVAAEKPANNKVEYLWSNEDGDAYGEDQLPEGIKGYITLKNGTITVDKTYVPANTDTVYVVAHSLDLGEDINDGEISEPLAIEINKTATAVPVTIAVGDILGTKSPEEHVSTEFNGNTLIVNDQPFAGLYDVTVSPKTGFEVNPATGRVNVTAAGTYTVTAKTKDGTNKSYSAKFKVGYDVITNVTPEVDVQLTNGETDEDVQTGTTEHAGIDLIAVTVDVDTLNGAIYDLKSVTLTASGAKRLPDFGGVALFKPTAAKATITVKNGKTEIAKYEIIDTKYSLTGKIKTTSFNFTADSTYAFGGDGFIFKFDKVTPATGDKLVFAVAESDYTPAKVDPAEDFVDFLNGNDVNQTLLNDGSVMVSSEARYTMPAGTYTVYATLVDATDNALTKPAKISFKAVKAAAPKAALNANISVRKGGTAVLNFKTFSNAAGYDANSFVALNNNVNGVVNNFVSYVESIQYNEETGNLILTANAVNDEVTSITGWIEYEVVGLDGKTTTFTDKVTLTFVAELEVDVIDSGEHDAPTYTVSGATKLDDDLYTTSSKDVTVTAKVAKGYKNVIMVTTTVNGHDYTGVGKVKIPKADIIAAEKAGSTIGVTITELPED